MESDPLGLAADLAALGRVGDAGRVLLRELDLVLRGSMGVHIQQHHPVPLASPLTILTVLRKWVLPLKGEWVPGELLRISLRHVPQRARLVLLLGAFDWCGGPQLSPQKGRGVLRVPSGPWVVTSWPALLAISFLIWAVRSCPHWPGVGVAIVTCPTTLPQRPGGGPPRLPTETGTWSHKPSHGDGDVVPQPSPQRQGRDPTALPDEKEATSMRGARRYTHTKQSA